jgi:hypothetical protein
MAGEYRDITGVVAFDPETADVNGKEVLRATIRSTGTREQSQLVGLTFWPSHKELFDKITKDTVVFVQGKYQVRPSGEKKYHNLSVAKVLIVGKLDGGEEVETTGDGGDGSGDDETW